MRGKPISKSDEGFKETQQILTQVRSLLGEHFESSLLMCSRETPQGTSFHTIQLGNKFAIRGMLETFIDDNCDREEKDAY